MKTVKPLIYRHWFMNSLVTMCYWVCSFAEWRGVFHISCIFFGPQSSISRIVQTTLLFLWQFLPLLHAILPEKIFVFAKLANMFLDMGFKGFSENSPPNLAWSLCWFISLSEGCLSWLTRFPLFLGYLHLLPSWFGYCCGSSWVSSWAFVFSWVPFQTSSQETSLFSSLLSF